MSKPVMAIDLNGLKLKNPVIVASGTFGFGREYGEYMDLNKIGAITVKGLTLEERQGNPAPRIVETPMGMINSVGLQNPGVRYFIDNELPFLEDFDTKIIANINGNTIEEYCKLAEKLDNTKVDSLELNISCPNVKEGGVAFGRDPEKVLEITKRIKESTSKHLIVKLSPNVRDIKEAGQAAEAGGADCISLINTLLGMGIDIETKKPILANVVGGLSGPAVKPVALRMVYEVSKVVKIPVIGMGGIMNYSDAVEFLLAGASAVSIGTANFINPRVSEEVAEGLEQYFTNKGYQDIKEVIGGLLI